MSCTLFNQGQLLCGRTRAKEHKIAVPKVRLQRTLADMDGFALNILPDEDRARELCESGCIHNTDPVGSCVRRFLGRPCDIRENRSKVTRDDFDLLVHLPDWVVPMQPRWHKQACTDAQCDKKPSYT